MNIPASVNSIEVGASGNGKMPAEAVEIANDYGAPGFGGACPPQAAGPLKIECGGLLRPGSAWSFAAGQIPAGAKSAVVYSLNATDIVKDERGNELDFSKLACSVLFDLIVGDHDEWLRFDEAYRLRGTFYANLGGAGYQGFPFTFSRSDTEIIVPTLGFEFDELGNLVPVYGTPIVVDGFRLVDGRASYGFGLQSFLLGFPMHFDWSWRSLMNRDYEDAVFIGGSDAFRRARFTFWIGYDF